jgi:hypothetical protein
MKQPVSTLSDEDMELRYRNAGVVPPADRAAGTYAEGRNILTMLHWLRGPRTAAAEPSNIFSLVKER